MNKEVNKNEVVKKSKSKKSLALDWLIQAIVLFAIFYAITWWQQRNMLSTEIENLAPSFSLISMTGEVINFRPENQQKKTLVYFFATWCSVCHASIDNIEAIKKSVGNDANFYAIALDWKAKEEVEDFLSQHKLTIPVLLGTKKTWNDFKISGFPSYYVIDKNGILASKDMGYTTELGMRFRLGL